MSLKLYLQALHVPAIVSALSLLASWLAITLLLNGNIKLSVTVAAAAFCLDTLDGYVARKMKRVTTLGRQLDSMIDLVNYSLYAGLLTSQVLLPGVLGVVAGYVTVLFGVLRLIRFNNEGYVEVEENRYYRGVVTCHLSLAAIGLLLLSTRIVMPPFVVFVVLVSLSVLQLSDIKTRKTKMLPFWYMITVLLVIGAWLWLP